MTGTMGRVLETSARLLRLLSLLQIRREWTGAQLADRLGVSARTVRADIGKLRSLGYPVDARPGVAGGYRLAAGTAMPPLLLDDDEAVAVAIGLGIVAARGLGVEETSLTALAKLEQVLPTRLRRRVEGVRESTSAVPAPEPLLDLATLGEVAGAIRRRERIRFDYTTRARHQTTRHAEPHRLVRWGALWYLLAWDLDRDDWRVFRVDRMRLRAPTSARFDPRPFPGDDAVALVVRRVSTEAWAYRARVLVHAPAAAVAAVLPIPLDLTVADESTCQFELGADDPDRLALWLARLGVDVEVIEGDELRTAFTRLSARFHRAAASPVTDRRAPEPPPARRS